MHFKTVGDSPLFLLPGGTEFDLYVPGGLTTLYVAFDQRELLAGTRALAPTGWDAPPDGLLSLGAAGRQVFIRTLGAALKLGRHVPDGAVLRRGLIHNVALAMHAGAPANPADAPGLCTRRRRHHYLREAQDYIHACLQMHTTPTIVDICAHVGVSERTLQYSFRELLQVTPIAYLRILRLNKARRELLNPQHAGATVTEVAVRYGFLHLGKFAQDYRRHFGEAPSATLFRALH